MNAATDRFARHGFSSSLTTGATIRQMKRRAFLGRPPSPARRCVARRLVSMCPPPRSASSSALPVSNWTKSASPISPPASKRASGLPSAWCSFTSRRIDAVDRNGPQLGAVLALNPDAAAIAGQLDRRAQGQSLCAARCTASRFCSRTTSKRATRLPPPPVRSRSPIGALPQDAFVVGSPARRGRHRPRQNQSQRVGQLPLHAFHQRLERARRPNQKPLRARSQSVRLQLRLGRRRRRQSVRRGYRYRDRWIGYRSLIHQRHRRTQAHRRTGQPLRHRPHLGQPGHRRAHGAHGSRRRDFAERDGRRSDQKPSKGSPDYTRFLDPHGLRGARLGIARKFFQNNAPLDAFLTGCVDALKKAGAEVIDPADLATHGQMDAPEGEVLLVRIQGRY